MAVQQVNLSYVRIVIGTMVTNVFQTNLTMEWTDTRLCLFFICVIEWKKWN